MKLLNGAIEPCLYIQLSSVIPSVYVTYTICLGITYGSPKGLDTPYHTLLTTLCKHTGMSPIKIIRT